MFVFRSITLMSSTNSFLSRLLTLLTVAMLLPALVMAGCMCGAQWTRTCALCSPAARRPGRYPQSLGRLHKGRLWPLTSRADALFGSSSLTYSLTLLLTLFLTHTLTHFVTHSLTHSLSRSLSYALTHSLFYTLSHSQFCV
jgi:hypothetical protein